MKAIRYNSFGGSEVLELTTIATPEITNKNEVLIRVKATTVNPFDIKVRSGLMQKMMPVQLPFYPGSDASGIVVDVGENVRHFKAGDEVMASSRGGTYAEYVVVKEDNVSLKPEHLSFGEAASLIVPVGTAQTVLFNEGQLRKGQKVFILGASGAVGGIMVQMAVATGAYVIGTASGTGLGLLKSLGAEEAIDYKLQDFTQFVNDVELAIDCAGGDSQVKLFEVIKKGGKLLSITMPPSAELAQKYGVEARFISSDISSKNLKHGLQLLEAGKLKPVIAMVFPLEQAAQAQNFLSAGSVNGKVVLEVK